MLIENLGVGVDIENIDRFNNFTNKQNHFLNRVFTNKELEYCFSKDAVAQHLAARFAGKEAVVKALCRIGQKIVDYKNIEIINDENKVPLVNLIGNQIENLKLEISLSHCKDKAIAFVIAIRS